jgi:hypothetical protein
MNSNLQQQFDNQQFANEYQFHVPPNVIERRDSKACES